MAEEEFEIDIYGDSGDGQNDSKNGNNKAFDSNNAIGVSGSGAEHDGDHSNDMQTDHNPITSRRSESLTSHDTKPPQGVKRKSDSDERPVDPGATTAILVSDLNWWNTDDDIRGWISKAHCEDEMKDVTFSEHKVNGKSKGQAYVEFQSVQAATAAKRHIDQCAEALAQPSQKRHAVIYTSPSQNPFKTLPKDAPTRAKQQDAGGRVSQGSIFHGNSEGGSRGNFSGGGGNFRGRFNRGGMNSHGGGFGNNRNFSGGNNMGGGGGFATAGMGGFNSNMGGGGSSGGGGMNMGGGFGFGNAGRGGMNMGAGMRGSGMRGGNRGGGGGGGGAMNAMMGGMPMGGMPMGGMPGPMGGMNMMGGAMGFNGMNAPFGGPPFFGGGAGNSGPNEWQNPHGTKRQRPE